MATQLTGILPLSGRVAIADAISRRPLHFVWGLGDGKWLDDVPPADIDAVGLMNEAGRRIISEWKFAIPDDGGSIITVQDPGSPPSKGRFSLSPGNAPTNHLYVNCQFDFDDGVGLVIREAAVVTNTETVEGLPAGQRYFTPGQIAAPGFLLYVQNLTPIFRSSQTQEYFETVITF